jgi:cytochrome c-type biogenesis protein CcmE
MMQVRYWVGALLIVAALAYLAVSSANETKVSYVKVSDVMAKPETAGGRGIRIVGYVVPGSIQAASAREVRFSVADGADTLRTVYRGVVPDTFKDGAEVVLEGQLGDDRVFAATTLLAKCPSKYESEIESPIETAAGRPATNGY